MARSVVLLTFLAVLFGLCIAAGADYFSRWRIPRPVAAVLIGLTALGVLVGIGVASAPQIVGQMRELRTELPAAIDRVEQWVGARYDGVVRMIQPAPSGDTAAKPAARRAVGADTTGADSAATQAVVKRNLARQVGKFGENFFAVFSSTLAALGGIILVIVVALYVAVDPKLYHRGLMHLFPHRMRPRAGEVLSEVATMLRRWLVTQLIAMVVIGSVTTVVLLLLNVRAAVALGIIAGLFEFIPYVGPVMAAVPAVAMGLLTSPQMALYVVIAYILIQQAENHLLIPLLMQRGIDMPPVVTILAQAVMGLVFGFLGLLVAMPLVGAAMVLIKMLYVQDVVGDQVPLPSDAANGTT